MCHDLKVTFFKTHNTSDLFILLNIVAFPKMVFTL